MLGLKESNWNFLQSLQIPSFRSYQELALQCLFINNSFVPPVKYCYVSSGGHLGHDHSHRSGHCGPRLLLPRPLLQGPGEEIPPLGGWGKWSQVDLNSCQDICWGSYLRQMSGGTMISSSSRPHHRGWREARVTVTTTGGAVMPSCNNLW